MNELKFSSTNQALQYLADITGKKIKIADVKVSEEIVKVEGKPIKLKSKKIGYQLYEVKYKGRTFEIDKQDNGEWSLYETNEAAPNVREWLNTASTKKEILEDIVGFKEHSEEDKKFWKYR